MTVQELINQLATLNPNARVVVRGYESGAVDARKVACQAYIMDAYPVGHYEGQHQEDCEYSRYVYRGLTTETCVFVG